MTKAKTVLALFMALLAISAGPLSRAQDAPAAASSQSAAQAAPSAATETQQKNVEEYIELLRTSVGPQKDEIMGAVLALDADQAKKFWPIYSEYDAELTKLNDLRIANIQEYARNYNQMTDAQADELIKKDLDYQKQSAELLAKYYGRVKESLGAIQAARFVQIEDQLLMLIDLQIASALPTAGQGS